MDGLIALYLMECFNLGSRSFTKESRDNHFKKNNKVAHDTIIVINFLTNDILFLIFFNAISFF